MVRTLVAGGTAILLLVGMGGCDTSLLSGLPGDTAKMISDQAGIPADDPVMDQIWQRDQLRDGSCPEGQAGAGEGRDGAGGGTQDRLRLRDGSCATAPSAGAGTGQQGGTQSRLRDGSCGL